MILWLGDERAHDASVAGGKAAALSVLVLPLADALFAGPEMVGAFGGVVSCTVTVKLLVVLLPTQSVAVHETVFTPSGKVAPFFGYVQESLGFGS